MKPLFSAFWLLLWPLLLTAQTPQDSVALATTTWQETPLEKGMTCRQAQLTLFGVPQYISVVSYPSHRFSTQIVQLKKGAKKTSRIGYDTKAVAAVNGSYFNMKTFHPVTYVRIGRHVYGYTTENERVRVNGVVALQDRRGKAIEIFGCTPDCKSIQTARRYHAVMAAGPMLVEQGKITKYDSKETFYTNRHPRTLVGLRANGEMVMVTIDGRFKENAVGMTIAETAYVAQQLGLVDAINLDGGGSTTLWTSEKGVLNHPYDNHRFDHEGERSVPNALVVRNR